MGLRTGTANGKYKEDHFDTHDEAGNFNLYLACTELVAFDLLHDK